MNESFWVPTVKRATTVEITQCIEWGGGMYPTAISFDKPILAAEGK